MNEQVVRGIVPADVSYDEKKLELHKLDSLTLLLYTFLLTLTVVTIWLFKHRQVNKYREHLFIFMILQESCIHS